MSDNSERPKDTEPNDEPRSSVVTVEDFTACEFESPLADVRYADASALASKFQQSFALTKNSETDKRVFGLLAALCDIRLTPQARANVWGPMMTFAGKRTAMPEDFRGEQNAVLASMIERVRHPGLRARLADIAWTNDRPLGKIAGHAVASYCECSEGLLAGTLEPRFESACRATEEAADFVHRALQIAYATSKRGKLPARVCAALKQLYVNARNNLTLATFARATELGLYYELFDPSEIVGEIESVAAGAQGQYPMAVKRVWDLGARLHATLGDETRRRGCQLAAVDQILAMRQQVSSASATAHWVMTALQALRHIKGVEEKEEELEIELRRLQRASMKEMAAFSIELDVKDDAENVIKHFQEFSLDDALLNFALLDKSRSVLDLREQAKKSIAESPIAAMMGASHVDDEGKTIRQTAGADGGAEPPDEWFRGPIARSESIHRAYIVGGRIEPARLIISQRFNVSERHFWPIVSCCPIVPPEHQAVVALGFARFFQGDFVSAAYLLLPQYESCLRHILKVNGHDPIRRFDDSTEENFDLAAMFGRLRPELVQIFTVDIEDELERLLHLKPGPALRHEIAHGQLDTATCFGADVIYANWLLYRICCLFVLRQWKDVIAPAIGPG